MDQNNQSEAAPAPSVDWISQREVAHLLGVTEQTASQLAKVGKLKIFEHGVALGGRRRYSRTLVERELQRCWEQAVQKQDGRC